MSFLIVAREQDDAARKRTPLRDRLKDWFETDVPHDPDQGQQPNDQETEFKHER